MLDRYVLPYQRAVLDRPARLLARAGLRADALTLAGFGCGVVAAGLIAQRLYLAGLAALLANRLLDGLDGAVARATCPSDRGAFLDIALDFVVYAGIPFAFAVAQPQANALAACALLWSFMGTASSFLAFAVFAAKRGLASPALPGKGFYYLGGLTEGTETFLALAAMCLAPAWFSQIAWVFAALAGLTTLSRWWWGWTVLRGPPQSPARAMSLGP